MKYKIFTRADLTCPFRIDNNIPDKYKTNNFARKFCKNGCCVVCSPLFWWIRILGQTEDMAPWGEFNEMVVNPNKIIMLPMCKETNKKSASKEATE